MKNTILIVLCFFVITCSTNDKDEFKNDQSLYENNSYKDYELFNLANNYIINDQLDLALTELSIDSFKRFSSQSFISKRPVLTSSLN